MLGQILVVIVMFVLGVVPCLFLTLSIPVVLIWKIYRKVRYGLKLTD